MTNFIGETVTSITVLVPRRPYSGSGYSRDEEVTMLSRILILAVGLLIALALLAVALVAVTTVSG